MNRRGENYITNPTPGLVIHNWEVILKLWNFPLISEGIVPHINHPGH